MQANTRCTQVWSPHGEVKLLLLPCSFLLSVDRLQTCSLSCMRVLVSVLGFLFCLPDPTSLSGGLNPPYTGLGGCCTCVGPATYTLTAGSGYSLLPSQSVLPSGTVETAQHGGAAIGDVRSRVARFLSCRLRLRRFRVGGRLHAPYCSSWRQSWLRCGRAAVPCRPGSAGSSRPPSSSGCWRQADACQPDSFFPCLLAGWL